MNERNLKFMGRPISPLTERRLSNFRANKRGYWSLWIFVVLFIFTLFAEFISNDKPLLVSFEENFYYPIFQSYPETVFGGDFETETNYTDPYVIELIEKKGWIIWPLIPLSLIHI